VCSLADPTHAVTMNGRINMALRGPEPSAEEALTTQLGRLDASRSYSFGLWRIPEGHRFDTVDLRTYPQEYLQAAGRRDSMTIEIRRLESAIARQYTLGRRASPRDPTVDIVWDAYATVVFANEVFGLDEASDVFLTYLRTADVSDGYDLRLLDL
jgi:hypothetical protein